MIYPLILNTSFTNLLIIKMADARKIIIIFVVAILFAIFVFSTIDAFYPNPEYNDFCEDNYRSPKDIINTCEPLEVSMDEHNSCEGNIDYIYDSTGCPTKSFCNTCYNEYDNAQDKHNQYLFYISAFFSLIAIFLGLYLPANKNALNEWVGTGFMLGGAFALFFGTANSFSSLDRWLRPIVILLELILVLFVAYKKIGKVKNKEINHKHDPNV